MRGTVPGLASPRPMGPAMPALYQEDPFAQGFLSALDTVLAPVMGTLDNLDAYLDPYLTPDDFLVWLANWVGMTVDDSWTIERRREAVARAVELYRLRGTATGLQEQIEIHTGGAVEIIENGGTAWSIDPGGEFPGSSRPLVVVRIQVDDPASIDASRVDALVAAAKPAHVEHRVEIVKPGGKKGPPKTDAAAATSTGDAASPESGSDAGAAG